MNRRDFAFISLRLIGLYLTVAHVGTMISYGISLVYKFWLEPDPLVGTDGRDLELIVSYAVIMMQPAAATVLGVAMFCAAGMLSNIVATSSDEFGEASTRMSGPTAWRATGVGLILIGAWGILRSLPLLITRIAGLEDSMVRYVAGSVYTHVAGGSVELAVSIVIAVVGVMMLRRREEGVVEAAASIRRYEETGE